jgi:hypothetical protein
VHGGERRRAAVKGLGCPKRRGVCTRTSASAWRNLWRPSRAATAKDDGARRAAAAVKLRRRRTGDAEHGGTTKQHRRAPYLTAGPRSSSEAGERRRRHGLEAAAQTEAAALGELGLGDGTKPTGGGGGFIGRGVTLVCGPTQGARHGRRVGVQPELDPGSVARRGGVARKKLTGGPRPSAAGDGAHGDRGSGPRWAGKFSWAGLHCGW